MYRIPDYTEANKLDVSFFLKLRAFLKVPESSLFLVTWD